MWKWRCCEKHEPVTKSLWPLIKCTGSLQNITRNDDSTYPVIRFWCSCIAISPDVVILVVRISGPAQVEPPVSITGVIRNEIHDQIQPCGKQREDSRRPSGETQTTREDPPSRLLLTLVATHLCYASRPGAHQSPAWCRSAGRWPGNLPHRSQSPSWESGRRGRPKRTWCSGTRSDPASPEFLPARQTIKVFFTAELRTSPKTGANTVSMRLLSTLCVDGTVLQTKVYNQALVRHFKIMLLQTILTLKIDLC